MRFVPRTPLYHDTPSWVRTGSLFFVTIGCASRGGVELTSPERAAAILESVSYYHRTGRWYARLFLIMPDHVHALIAFAQGERMEAVVLAWKRYTARNLGMRWQRGFFDHRLRNDENWQLKADYIRRNPVRKGLVARPEDWPWVFEP